MFSFFLVNNKDIFSNSLYIYIQHYFLQKNSGPNYIYRLLLTYLILIIRGDTRDDLCVCVRYIDFRATGNTARRRPGDVTYTR